MQSIYDDINSSDAFESSGLRRKPKKNKTSSKLNTLSISDTESSKKDGQSKEKTHIKKYSNEERITQSAELKKRPWLDEESSMESFIDTPIKSGSKKTSENPKSKHSSEHKSYREDRVKSKTYKDEKSSKHHKYSHDKKKKKSGSLPPLPPSVATLMTELKEATGKESFENKAKFPPALRPILTRIANAYMLATGVTAPDEDLISHLTSILPYNKFTLKKLSTKIMLQERLRVRETQFEEFFTGFGEKVKAQMKLLVEQHEEMRKRGEEGDENGEFSMDRSAEPNENTPVKKEPEEYLTPNSKLDQSMNTPNSIAEDGGLVSSEDKLKKFRWNEDLRHGLYQVMKCEMDITNLKNELLELEGHSVKPLSETNQRRAVYQKILIFFEPGWTTSYEISREYSLYKRRIDKRLSKEVSREDTQSQKKTLTTESRLHESKHPSSPGKKRPSSSNGGKYDSRSKVYKILSEMGPSFLSDTDSSDDDVVHSAPSKKSSHSRGYSQKHSNTASTVIDYDDITSTDDDDISASNTDSSISSSSISSGSRRRLSSMKKKKLTATESLVNYKKSKEEKAVDSMIAKRKRQKKRQQMEKLEQQKQHESKGKEQNRVKESKEASLIRKFSLNPESNSIISNNPNSNEPSRPLISSTGNRSTTPSSSVMDLRNLIV
ncbi:hypothetical protein K7432_009476 [Basidiobolus ranarum]|uniref:Ubinuclein middle domain-containing protein n=1 Tax=Basidiobolus ranarum TaxID=34480 RepID=A0ABR2VX06_9FUNG